jgi:hypothetical protein
MAIFNGSGLGWTFDTELDDATGKPPPSGLSLQKVRHDGHNFAQDIRLIGIWATVEHLNAFNQVTGTSKKFIEVTARNFQFDPVRTIDPKTRTIAAKSGISSTFDYLKNGQTGLSFADYFEDGANYAVYGLVATCHEPNLFTNMQIDNCLQDGLKVEQTLLFSRYGNDPPHEPSGGLTAARCHPMVSFEMTPNRSWEPAKPYTRIASLRFDFRLHLYLDAYLKDKTASGLYDAQQAGLFADTDSGSTRALLKGARHHFSGSFAKIAAREAFYAIEKPLVREVVGPGLIKGKPAGDFPKHADVVCWDNVHWWGGRGGPLPSTPGAFHAAHLHWRWGEFLSSWAGRATSSAWRRFNPGDALVDPRVRRQDLFVAIAKYNRATDPARVALSMATAMTWEDLFHQNNFPTPDLIKSGADLVLWYSAEVYPDEHAPWGKGAVFLHGIFFAHNREPEDFSISVGSRQPLYWPRDESDIEQGKTWFRSAND